MNFLHVQWISFLITLNNYLKLQIIAWQFLVCSIVKIHFYGKKFSSYIGRPPALVPNLRYWIYSIQMFRLVIGFRCSICDLRSRLWPLWHRVMTMTNTLFCDNLLTNNSIKGQMCRLGPCPNLITGPCENLRKILIFIIPCVKYQRLMLIYHFSVYVNGFSSVDYKYNLSTWKFSSAWSYS